MRVLSFGLSLLFVFMIPWEGVEVGNLGSLAQPVGLLLAGAWMTAVAVRGRFREPSPFHLAVCLFVLWNAVSVLWSADPTNTAGRVVTWLQLLVFVFMMWDLYTTRTAVLAALQAYVLGAYVALGSALSNFFSGAVYYSNFDRFSSGDTNPDGFGFILALGMPLAWYLASRESTTRIGLLARLLNFAYVPAALLGISLSGTRTAMIATIPAMLFGLASLARVRPAVRVAALVFLAGAVLALLPRVQTLASFQRFGTVATELAEGDLNNRTNNWREGLTSFAQHPLTGVGSNMYRSVNSLGKVAHNSYISVLVELGLVGFGLFGWILAMAGRQALGQPIWDRSFWLSLLAVWAIGASTLTWEHRKSTWLFLGLVVASAALTQPREEAPARVPAFTL